MNERLYYKISGLFSCYKFKVHAWRHRADNKMYLLQYPQSPLLKTEAYDKYEIDDYPLGTNACVAVISYTGYDMEGKHFVMIVYKT